MTVFKIDNKTTSEEIQEFYDLYIRSFPDLCIWKGDKIINLGDYLEPSLKISNFHSELDVILNKMEIVIYYTHNNGFIQSIAFVQLEEPTHCFITIKYLCGNQKTRDKKIEGKSQGIYLLDYIFSYYHSSLIKIEPATANLIPYYTSYKKPCFPYDNSDFLETFKFLIYGNLRRLDEECFKKIFRSLNILNSFVNTLQFKSLDNLYSGTSNISNLKDKLIVKLEHLVKTKQIDAQYYEQMINNIMKIKYYDIDDIILTSYNFERNISSSSALTNSLLKSGGKKKRKTRNNIRKTKKKKHTKRKD
jgi:hypothetical protein